MSGTENGNVRVAVRSRGNGILDISRQVDTQLQIARMLSDFAASTYLLHHKSLYHYWRVTGPEFVYQSRILQEHCRQLLEATGQMFRRIYAMGYAPSDTLTGLMEVSSVREDGGQQALSVLSRLHNLRAGHNICQSEALQVCEIAEAAQDKLTAGLMAQQASFHDRALRELDHLL